MEQRYFLEKETVDAVSRCLERKTLFEGDNGAR